MNGKKSNGVYLVLSECADLTQASELNDWYSNTHLSDLVGTGLFHHAWLYEAATVETPKYLAVYEIDEQDLEATAAEYTKIRERLYSQGLIHPALQVVRRAFMRTRGFFTFRNPNPGTITGLLAMGSNPKTSGTDDAFNDWYDNVHMNDINNTGLHALAHRLETLESQAGDLRYMNLYETDLEDVAEALNGLGRFRQGWIDAGTYYDDRVFLVRGAYRLIADHPG